MAADYSNLISLLQGGESVRKSLGATSEDILRDIRQSAGSSNALLTGLKNEMLARALLLQKIGSAA